MLKQKGTGAENGDGRFSFGPRRARHRLNIELGGAGGQKDTASESKEDGRFPFRTRKRRC